MIVQWQKARNNRVLIAVVPHLLAFAGPVLLLLAVVMVGREW